MRVATLQRGFFRGLAVFAACLLLLLGLATGSSATTVTFTVQSDRDDAAEVGSDGSSWDNSGDIYLRVIQNSSGSQGSAGFRFSGATIPNGSTINSATFKPHLSTPVNDDLWCRIYGERVSSSSDFSVNQNVFSRTRTTAYTAISAEDKGMGLRATT